MLLIAAYRARTWLLGSLVLGALVASSYGCTQILGFDHEYVETGATSGSGGAAGSSSVSSSSSSSTGGRGAGMISCGSKSCPLGGNNACCWPDYKTANARCVNAAPADDGCTTELGAGAMETRIECQLPSQCPMGTVCCGVLETQGPNTYYSSVTCQATCPSPNFILCAKLGEMLPTCPDGRSCQPSNDLPADYLVCKQ